MAFATVFLVVLFLGCINTSTNDQQSEKLRVGFVPIADAMQLYVAQEQGFFEKNGIVVETIPLNGGPLIASAVASGDIDIGFSATFPLVVLHDRGTDFQILATAVLRKTNGGAGNFLFVSPEIDSVSQLEGKLFAINSFGSVNELIVKEWMPLHGVDASQVTLVELAFPEIEAAMKNGQIQGAIVEEPFRTLMREHETGREIDFESFSVINDRVLMAAWFAQKPWIEKNSTAVMAFKKSIEEAGVYVREHPTQAQQILSKYTGMEAGLASRITLPLFEEKLEIQDIQSLIRSAHSNGFIENEFDASELFFDASIFS